MSSRLSREILGGWRRSLPRIALSGLSRAAGAYVLADLLAQSESKLVILCAGPDEAAQTHQDLRTFLRLLGKSSVADAVDYFPGWEHSPYRPFNPSIRNRVRRLRALHRASSGLGRALVTDVSAFAQWCPSPAGLKARTLELRPSDIVGRDSVSQLLENAGYTRNDPVEDPGQYAVRGGLLDVFSPSSRRPFRIDFFDEMVETIRSFDPASQRGDPELLPSAAILPVTEWSFTPATVAAAKRAIKSFCDERGIPKQSRDELFERLDSGIRDPNLDYLCPYFEEDSAWLHEFLGAEWKVVQNDSLGVEAAYDRLARDLKSGFEQSVSEGRISAPWDTLYLGNDGFAEALRLRVALKLDTLALGVPAPAPSAADAEEAAPPEGPDASGKIRVKTLANTDFARSDGGSPSFDVLAEKLRHWAEGQYIRAFVASTSSQLERIRFLLGQKDIPCRVVERVDWEDRSIIQISEGRVSAGFRLPGEGIAVVTDAEIFGPKKGRAPKGKASGPRPDLASFVPSLEDLNTDELVVHAHHGVGRYRGLVKLALEKIPQDFLLIEYAGADKLYLPVYRLDQVQRYVGAQESVGLDKLGSAHFEKTKEKVKAELLEIAHHLLQLYAQRASRTGFAFSEPDEAFREFEAKFPYAETADQLRTIEDVVEDMRSDRIMDRLVCGDVGYGKTEVAMRAAFRAATDGKQVAVLVPTTVLAMQHERSFRDRFRDAPVVNIGVLSRFKTAKETKDTLAGLRSGAIDVVIGTHRLLSKDVAFKDLGLLIVDEEQRFGVEHKERLKALKYNTDVLTLTATPIPRTLHLSLMGLRDISVINTPPVDRLSVRTYVAKFDEDIVRSAIEQEIARGGQVFFIHNRVQTIHSMADRLQSIVPAAKILVAHGQLEEKELEKRMLEFYSGKANVLLCSTIIESGLDIPSANTMIINRSDTFGLAQLYQLRGRVGRSQVRAYCYLLLPEEGAVTEEARKRLEVIQRFADLGSGFKIASHDLELRGGGEILGKSQTGHIAAVGFELYTDLLAEAVQALKGQPPEDRFDPEIKFPAPALLPESYVPDVHQRLGLYKRLSQAATDDALGDLTAELKDRYGEHPPEVTNLVWLIRIRQLLRTYKIKSLVAGAERTALEAGDGAKLSPAKFLALARTNPKDYTLTPDSKIIVKRPFRSAQILFQDVQKLLAQVAEH